MKKITFLILIVSATSQVTAQFVKNRALDLSAGLGYSMPYDDDDIHGSGFYAQGEYVLTLASWIDLRPYAGLILTTSEQNDNNVDRYLDKTTANAFLFGGKTRITAPIPWVAPYFEIGLGASVGAFETFTPVTSLKKNGLLSHIPVSIGLELGRRHNFGVAFTYYYHNSVRQFIGAAAFGVTIPLNT